MKNNQCFIYKNFNVYKFKIYINSNELKYYKLDDKNCIKEGKIK